MLGQLVQLTYQRQSGNEDNTCFSQDSKTRVRPLNRLMRAIDVLVSETWLEGKRIFIITIGYVILLEESCCIHWIVVAVVGSNGLWLHHISTWALTDIVSGILENTKVVFHHRVVPFLVKLLGFPSDDVCEQVCIFNA